MKRYEANLQRCKPIGEVGAEQVRPKWPWPLATCVSPPSPPPLSNAHATLAVRGGGGAIIGATVAPLQLLLDTHAIKTVLLDLHALGAERSEQSAATSAPGGYAPIGSERDRERERETG